MEKLTENQQIQIRSIFMRNTNFHESEITVKKFTKFLQLCEKYRINISQIHQALSIAFETHSNYKLAPNEYKFPKSRSQFSLKSDIIGFLIPPAQFEMTLQELKNCKAEINTL